MARPEPLLTPATLELWGQFLLAGLLFAFLLSWRNLPGRQQSGERTKYLGLALFFYLLCLLMLGLHVSMLKTERMPSIASMYPLVAASLFALTRFVYRMPALPSGWRREERIASLAIFALFAWECAYGVFRLRALAQGQVYIRPIYHDVAWSLVVLWQFGVLVRQTLRVSAGDAAGGPWRQRLWAARSADARATRALLPAWFILLVMGAGVAGQAWLGMSRGTVYFWTSLLSMGALLTIVLVYANFYVSSSAFVVQVTGVIVLLVILVVSAAGRSIAAPLVAALTGVAIETPPRTIRFTPVADGGYQAAVLPLAAASGLRTGEEYTGGPAIRVQATAAQAKGIDLPFAFTFFGRSWSTVYVDPAGFLTFGTPQARRNLEHRYGAIPAIFALYRSKPGALVDQPETWEVTVQLGPDQAHFRWSTPGAGTDPAAARFQVILNADGTFAIEHRQVPPVRLTSRLLATGEGAWRVGVGDGRVAPTPQRISWPAAGSPPLRVERTTVDDYELAFRRLAHPLYRQLALLLLVSVLMAVGAVPLFLRAGLMQPLERLLHGIERVEKGDLGVHIPIYAAGEIGAITGTFNRLVASQRELLGNLEAQVVERTQQFELANRELQAEICLRREAQRALEELNRDLDTRVQVRTFELAQSEERFRRVVTSISDQVFAVVVDPETCQLTIDFLSTRLMEMLGVDESSASNLLVHWRDAHVAPEDLATYDQHIASVLAGRDSQTEYRFLQPDGRRRWVRASVRCERLETSLIRCYGVVSDISHRKQLEEETATRLALQEVERLRSEWLGNMSHELRTPLGLIKTAATTLLAKDVTIPAPMQQQILAQLDYETDRLTDLVDALLDLSRVDAGRLRLAYAEADVAALMAEVAAAATLQMQLGGIPWFRLALELEPATQPAVVDRERLKRVLQNLLTNAMKFSPENSLITLRACLQASMLCIEIEDQGIGIAPADYERIFERYFQVRHPGLRSHNGVGLGLPICREIVLAHGGTIAVTSREAGRHGPGGTTFTLRIPRQPIDGGEA